jgi:phosphopantetheine adenylyltransferase
VEKRKDELMAKIRERRAKLDRTMEQLDDRIAVIGEIKDTALRTGRLAAIVVAISTVALASVLLLRAVSRWSRRPPVAHRWR